MVSDGCAAFRAIAPELALGVAEGEERAAALEHLTVCDDCRAELARLAEAVDAVVQTAPEAAPPSGFETRALASFGRAAAEAPARPHRRWWLAAAAAVVALVAAVAVWPALTRQGDPGADQVATSRAAAALTAPDGRRVGTVAVERRRAADGGSTSELVVSVDAGAPEGTYRVTCDYDTGPPYPAGQVAVTADGVQGWRASVSVPTYDLRRVRLVSTDEADNLEAEFPS